MRRLQQIGISLCVLLLASACASDDTAATSTSATTPTTTEASSEAGDPTTTSAPEPALPFVLPPGEVQETSANSAAAVMSIEKALVGPDEDDYLGRFHPGAKYSDPVKPSVKPGPDTFYMLYGGTGPTGMDYAAGNGHGGVAIDEGDPEGDWFAQWSIIRQYALSDELAEWGMSRFDSYTLSEYADEVVKILYIPLSEADNARRQAATADEFVEQFVAAWNGGEAAVVAALYAEDAIRIDAFAGDPTSREQILGWTELVMNTHDDLTINTVETYASDYGPGLVYDMTMTGTLGPCSMRAVSIWNLDDQGLITEEYVYYTPDTVLACDWAS